MKKCYHSLEFKQPSGTSRGVLRTKDSWFVMEDESQAISEISIIEGLSIETKESIEALLQKIEHLSDVSVIKDYPAVQFALEILELSAGSDDPFGLFDGSFYQDGAGIPINGLVWMGTKEFMFDQIKKKLNEGYSCLKLKIGAIDFEEELSLLQYIRSQFSPNDVELRVDANGAFSAVEAMAKLQRLSEYQLHSIEQPVKPKQWDLMAELCEGSPLDIALDEELIGLTFEDRDKLITHVKPQYIILKPSLIGGFNSADDWIAIAEDHNVGWWATSALESNIGLNAIAQWVSTKDTNMPQGLGTGQLYTNNIPSPLIIRGGILYYDQDASWDLSILKF